MDIIKIFPEYTYRKDGMSTRKVTSKNNSKAPIEWTADTDFDDLIDLSLIQNSKFKISPTDYKIIVDLLLSYNLFNDLNKKTRALYKTGLCYNSMVESDIISSYFETIDELNSDESNKSNIYKSALKTHIDNIIQLHNTLNVFKTTDEIFKDKKDLIIYRGFSKGRYNKLFTYFENNNLMSIGSIITTPHYFINNNNGKYRY